VSGGRFVTELASVPPRLGFCASSVGALAALAVACASSHASTSRVEPTPAASQAAREELRAAASGPQRGEQEKARDVYRHPVETLEFLGARGHMNVVELWPGGGWYTAILAPLLRERGGLTVATGDPDGDPKAEPTQDAKAFLARRDRQPDVFDRVARVQVPATGDIVLGPPESADAVLTFRNLHTFVWLGIDRQILAASFRVLKHGGVLGLTDHRAPTGGSTDPKVLGDTGYIPEAYAIELVEQAGFRLAARSEINANPRDTKDYEGGVWALPPTYTNGAKDHAKYEAIGESDRMTLKFVKP
jgi:predicted methyltransferase